MEPLSFVPLFFPRVWGGRKLESVFSKNLPPAVNIGESWELVDRPEAQSVVRRGRFSGRSLHSLWANHRREIFGAVTDAPRFPILVKLLDCRETLSLQVHPPEEIAEQLGGEPKNEWWYVADAEPNASLCLGVRDRVTPETFSQALESERIDECVQTVQTKKGDAFSVPAGRLHAIGAGNLIIEVQQNSDTTYRVFDWNRRDEQGRGRELHLSEAMQAIDFGDTQIRPEPPKGATLVANRYFQVDRISSNDPSALTIPSQGAILVSLDKPVRCGGEIFQRGEFFILPAIGSAGAFDEPLPEKSTLLRITLPAA